MIFSQFLQKIQTKTIMEEKKELHYKKKQFLQTIVSEIEKMAKQEKDINMRPIYNQEIIRLKKEIDKLK